VFLLSTFYHAFSVVASSIFGTQITLVFAVARRPPSPHLHGGIRHCLSRKTANLQKLIHRRSPVEQMYFSAKPNESYCSCVNALNSRHGSAQTAVPFLRFTIDTYHA